MPSETSTTALPLSSAQRDTLDGATQTILVTAALTLAITVLTFMRLRHGHPAALDWALLAASAVAFGGQLMAGLALRNALIIEGAEPAPLFSSLRWLALVFALKAVVVLLTVTTVLLRLKAGGGLL